MNKKLVLQVLLVFVGVSHLALGLLANLASSDTLTSASSLVYGAAVEVSPQLHHLIRMLGAFMLGVGALAFVASRDPQRHGAIVRGIAGILVLRVIQRVVAGDEIMSAFGISPARLWVQAVFFLALALALLFLVRKPAASHLA
ncbi:MAG TPA: hypothetical protein VMM36_00305 [Opitutaceae bacterium]|nr:hypothetical protein [Opitutaceae bacterium]